MAEMGRLWFHDTLTDQWDFILDWNQYSKNYSYSVVEMKIGDDIERITGWEYNRKIFDSSTSLMLNGKANYGKRGRIYDIDNESNIDIKEKVLKRVNRDKRLNEIL